MGKEYVNPKFFGNWCCVHSLLNECPSLKEFFGDNGYCAGRQIISAGYFTGDYEGSATIYYVKWLPWTKGVRKYHVYSLDSSHCSCNGIGSGFGKPSEEGKPMCIHDIEKLAKAPEQKYHCGDEEWQIAAHALKWIEQNKVNYLAPGEEQ